MTFRFSKTALHGVLAFAFTPVFTMSNPEPVSFADGYRGIWFSQKYPDKVTVKYSGGLGTYTSNHQPMAEYAPAVDKTFFTYGGTPSADKRELAIMVSYYDHARGEVPRPTTVYLDPSVDDPHDNASLRIGEDGRVWLFKSGRNFTRPGLVFRSVAPYDISAFERVSTQEFTYPQVWRRPDGGWFMLFTKYGAEDGKVQRNLFWKTSADGLAWGEDHLLAAFGGHYQTSGQQGGKFATFFNWHPDSDNDRRTNLYYAQTTDDGKTWTTAGGAPIEPPLTRPDNAALALDLQAEGKVMYTCDLNFDARGNPLLLCILGSFEEPGSHTVSREWTVLHWSGAKWERSVVAVSDHNYDMGSIAVDGAAWRVTGPTGSGPQKGGVGGEIETWVSRDEGATWVRERSLTANSEMNHSYVRRPTNAHPDFATFWADGNPDVFTPSRLYFANSDGTRVWRLPHDMTQAFAKPEPVGRPGGAAGK